MKATIEDQLKELFDCAECRKYEGGSSVEYELDNEAWGATAALTYERLERLPEILGTKRINFRTEHKSDGWSEETGSWGGHESLTIEVLK